MAVAAMSYDGQDVRAAFHAEHALGYPLLQDIDTRHFGAYGVLNPEYGPGHRAYGIPLPGVLFIAPDGRIRAKFAVPDYRERPSFEDIHARLAAELGDTPADG